MRSRNWLAAGFLFLLPGAIQAETCPAVTFTLVPQAPVFSSIKSFSFQLYKNWDQKGLLVVHSAEWEIRDLDHHHLVARIPAQEYFEADQGMRDERPPHPEGARYDFDKDDLLHIGELKPGTYQMSLLINGARASNVIAFRIDSSYDVTKASPPSIGMHEAPPGEKIGALLAWAVGPNPSDERFTNDGLAFADIFVDGVLFRPDRMSWIGPAGPYAPGQLDVRTFDDTYRLKGVNLRKPHDFSLQFGKYRSPTVRFDLSSQILAHQWDKEATAPATPAK